MQHSTAMDSDTLVLGRPCYHSHPKQQSPLLSLPPELRNKIYALVFPSTHTIDCWTLKPTDRSSNALSLIQTCRQLHTEIKWLPFTLPTFVFPTYATFTRLLTSLANRPAGKEQLEKIRNLEFRIEVENVTVSVPVFGGGEKRAMPMYWWNEKDLGFWEMGMVSLRRVGVVFVRDGGRGWEGVDDGEFWKEWEGLEVMIGGLWRRGGAEKELDVRVEVEEG